MIHILGLLQGPLLWDYLFVRNMLTDDIVEQGEFCRRFWCYIKHRRSPIAPEKFHQLPGQLS